MRRESSGRRHVARGTRHKGHKAVMHEAAVCCCLQADTTSERKRGVSQMECGGWPELKLNWTHRAGSRAGDGGGRQATHFRCDATTSKSLF